MVRVVKDRQWDDDAQLIVRMRVCECGRRWQTAQPPEAFYRLSRRKALSRGGYDWGWVGGTTGHSKSRMLARPVTFHDAGDVHFRGAQCWAINGDDITLKIALGGPVIVERVVDVALFESGMPSIGDPIVVAMTGTGHPNDYVIVRAKFGNGAMVPPDQAESVARGEVNVSLLNGCVGGVSVYQDGGN